MASKIKGRLFDRIAIVTGASRGIGRACALALAREGAKVVVNYHLEKEKASEVVKEIEKLGGEAFAFQADVGDRDAIEKMVGQALETFGTIDILVNNAGVMMRENPLLEFKEEEYDSMWRVNVKGVLNCTKAVMSRMIKQHYGKIVNIASIGGLGTATSSMLYGSTKAAVIILTKRLALELGQYGINVNAIAPGLIQTDMSERRDKKYFIEKTMLRRVGEPKEIADVVLFLASDESSFVTGQTITVDGGRIDLITHSA